MAALLIVHSLLRWLFLFGIVAMIVVAVRGRMSGSSMTPGQRRLGVITVGLADLQLLVGFLLYFGFSTWLDIFKADPGAAMRDRTTRFFAVEHPTVMLVAIVVLHIAWARAKRADVPTVAWRRVLVGFLLALALVMASIPWPFLAHGRPLLRLG